MTRTDPVIIELNCEAHPSTNTVEYDRADWEAMTPAERAEALDDMVETHMANAGGGGWYIADPADEASVGSRPVRYPVNVEEVMKMVVRYGVECNTAGPFTENADEWLNRIRAAITDKEK